MRRLLLSCAAALALTGCGPMLAAMGGGAAPAPLAQTVIDDKALDALWKSFDVTLDALNVLGDMGVIVPGTPRGRAVADGIRRVNRALAAAERFAAAGSSGDYAAALRDATAAFNDLRAAIKGGN